jgi:Zn-dependent protease
VADGGRRPGPWDAVETAPARPREDPAARRDADGGRHLLWSVISTAVFGGFLWWLLGPIPALAVIFGLLVHEYGHVMAINSNGLGPGRIHIIPFLGGAAVAKKASPTEWIDVKIAIAGPLFGILAAIPFFAAWWFLGDAAWLQGAFLIGLINFVNLAPAPPLDGSKVLGPALARVHPMLEKVALIAIGAAAVAWALDRGSYIFALFIAISLLGALKSGWRTQAAKLDGTQQALTVLVWLAALAICFGALFAAVRLGGSEVAPFDVLRSL